MEERIDSLAYHSFFPSSLLQPSENDFDEVEDLLISPRDQASTEQADLAKRRVVHLLGKNLPQNSDAEEIEELGLVIDYFQRQEQLPFDKRTLEELEQALAFECEAAKQAPGDLQRLYQDHIRRHLDAGEKVLLPCLLKQGSAYRKLYFELIPTSETHCNMRIYDAAAGFEYRNTVVKGGKERRSAYFSLEGIEKRVWTEELAVPLLLDLMNLAPFEKETEENLYQQFITYLRPQTINGQVQEGQLSKLAASFTSLFKKLEPVPAMAIAPHLSGFYSLAAFLRCRMEKEQWKKCKHELRYQVLKQFLESSSRACLFGIDEYQLAMSAIQAFARKTLKYSKEGLFDEALSFHIQEEISGLYEEVQRLFKKHGKECKISFPVEDFSLHSPVKKKDFFSVNAPLSSRAESKSRSSRLRSTPTAPPSFGRPHIAKDFGVAISSVGNETVFDVTKTCAIEFVHEYIDVFIEQKFTHAALHELCLFIESLDVEQDTWREKELTQESAKTLLNLVTLLAHRSQHLATKTPYEGTARGYYCLSKLYVLSTWLARRLDPSLQELTPTLPNTSLETESSELSLFLHFTPYPFSKEQKEQLQALERMYQESEKSLFSQGIRIKKQAAEENRSQVVCEIALEESFFDEISPKTTAPTAIETLLTRYEGAAIQGLQQEDRLREKQDKQYNRPCHAYLDVFSALSTDWLKQLVSLELSLRAVEVSKPADSVCETTRAFVGKEQVARYRRDHREFYENPLRHVHELADLKSDYYSTIDYKAPWHLTYDLSWSNLSLYRKSLKWNIGGARLDTRLYSWQKPVKDFLPAPNSRYLEPNFENFGNLLPKDSPFFKRRPLGNLHVDLLSLQKKQQENADFSSADLERVHFLTGKNRRVQQALEYFEQYQEEFSSTRAHYLPALFLSLDLSGDDKHLIECFYQSKSAIFEDVEEFPSLAALFDTAVFVRQCVDTPFFLNLEEILHEKIDFFLNQAEEAREKNSELISSLMAVSLHLYSLEDSLSEESQIRALCYLSFCECFKKTYSHLHAAARFAVQKVSGRFSTDFDNLLFNKGDVRRDILDRIAFTLTRNRDEKTWEVQFQTSYRGIETIIYKSCCGRFSLDSKTWKLAGVESTGGAISYWDEHTAFGKELLQAFPSPEDFVLQKAEDGELVFSFNSLGDVCTISYGRGNEVLLQKKIGSRWMRFSTSEESSEKLASYFSSNYFVFFDERGGVLENKKTRTIEFTLSQKGHLHPCHSLDKEIHMLGKDAFFSCLLPNGHIYQETPLSFEGEKRVVLPDLGISFAFSQKRWFSEQYPGYFVSFVEKDCDQSALERSHELLHYPNYLILCNEEGKKLLFANTSSKEASLSVFSIDPRGAICFRTQEEGIDLVSLQANSGNAAEALSHIRSLEGPFPFSEDSISKLIRLAKQLLLGSFEQATTALAALPVVFRSDCCPDFSTEEIAGIAAGYSRYLQMRSSASTLISLSPQEEMYLCQFLLKGKYMAFMSPIDRSKILSREQFLKANSYLAWNSSFLVLKIAKMMGNGQACGVSQWHVSMHLATAANESIKRIDNFDELLEEIVFSKLMKNPKTLVIAKIIPAVIDFLQARATDEEKKKFLRILHMAKNSFCEQEESPDLLSLVIVDTYEEVATKGLLGVSFADDQVMTDELQEKLKQLIATPSRLWKYQFRTFGIDSFSRVHKSTDVPIIDKLEVKRSFQNFPVAWRSPETFSLERCRSCFSLKETGFSQEEMREFLERNAENSEGFACLAQDFISYAASQEQKPLLIEQADFSLFLQGVYWETLSSECENLENQMLQLANRLPQGGQKQIIRSLEAQSSLCSAVTLPEILLGFARKDTVLLQRLQPHLTKKDFQTLWELTAKFLYTKTLLQKRERMLALLQRFDETESDLERFSLSSLLYAYSQDSSYDMQENPEMLLFEYYADISLWGSQVETFKELVSSEKTSKIIELLMGSGKTKVLMPLIALSRADGEKLSLIVVPQELFESVAIDTYETNRTFFGQLIKGFNFSREVDLSLGNLQKILFLLEEVIQGKQALITTNTTLHGFMLKAVELVSSLNAKSSLTSENNQQLSLISEIVHILLNRTKALFDEAHKTFDPLSEVNYSDGNRVSLSPSVVSMASFFYDLLLREDVQERLGLEVQQGDLPVVAAAFFTDEKKRILAEIFLENIHGLYNLLPDRYIDELEAFLQEDPRGIWVDYLSKTGNVDEAKRAYKKISSDSVREIFSFASGEIAQLLKQTLCREHNVHFGFESEQADFATPYTAANTPAMQSEFQNVYVTLNYTLQTYLAQGATDFHIEALFKQLKSAALAEIKQTRIQLKETQSYKQMLKMFERDFPILNMPKSSLEEARQIINSEARKRLAFGRMQSEKISTYEKSLTSKSQTLAALFSSNGQGFSGTVWNQEAYHRSLEPRQAEGISAKTVSLLFEQVQSLICLSSNQSVSEFLDELAREEFSMLIDAGGVFKEDTNEGVARTLSDKWGCSVVYYNSDNRQTILIDGEEKPFLSVLQTESTKTYLDMRHTVGADITQKPDAVGLITIGRKMLLYNLQQAAWRLRGLDKQQKARFVVTDEVGRDIRQTLSLSQEELLTKEHVFAYVVFNQEDLKRKQVQKAFGDELLSVGQAEFLQILGNKKMAGKKKLTSLAALLPFWGTEANLSTEALFGQVQVSSKEEFIQGAVSRTTALLRKAGKDKKKEIEDVVEKYRPFLPEEMDSRQGGEDTCVEVETQVEQQTQTQTLALQEAQFLRSSFEPAFIPGEQLLDARELVRAGRFHEVPLDAPFFFSVTDLLKQQRIPEEVVRSFEGVNISINLLDYSKERSFLAQFLRTGELKEVLKKAPLLGRIRFPFQFILFQGDEALLLPPYDAQFHKGEIYNRHLGFDDPSIPALELGSQRHLNLMKIKFLSGDPRDISQEEVEYMKRWLEDAGAEKMYKFYKENILAFRKEKMGLLFGTPLHALFQELQVI